MIELRPLLENELALLTRMEGAPRNAATVTAESPDAHLARMRRPDWRYLAVCAEDRLVGYVMLRLSQMDEVELRRVVIDEAGAGFGQQALAATHALCRDAMQARSIWLDVYADNRRARHVYSKLGYREFKRSEAGGRTLVFMRKSLI